MSLQSLVVGFFPNIFSFVFSLFLTKLVQEQPGRIPVLYSEMHQFGSFAMQQVMKESNEVLMLLTCDVLYCGPVI